MPYGPSLPARTRGDAIRAAIGDVTLRLIKQGRDVTAPALAAILEREGAGTAAKRVRDAAEAAEKEVPPKPSRKR